MPDEHLLDPFRFRQPRYQLKRSFHRPIEFRIAALPDRPGGVERHILHGAFGVWVFGPVGIGFLFVNYQFLLPIPPEMVELLKGKSERIHESVTLPAVLLTGLRHPCPQRRLGFIGELGVNANRHIRDFPA